VTKDQLNKRPPVWQMIRQAIEALGGKTTNVAIKEWILKRYPGTNTNTIQCQIIICTVNHRSRIHYPENKKPRIANTQYDFLFRPERGEVELYNPAKHGRWEIYQREDGRLDVRQIDSAGNDPETDAGTGFAAESHLRDYLAQHLDLIEPGLELFVDDDGTTGVEYITPIGRIDILAVDDAGGLVVIELKVSRGSDAVAGQVLRYKNWVERHIANGQRVRGIIIAQHISDKILYAIANDPDVTAKEYEINLILHDIEGLGAET